MPHELTLEMGGAGGEFSPPLEAPQGAGHQLTAAAVPLENHINWSPLVAPLDPARKSPPPPPGRPPPRSPPPPPPLPRTGPQTRTSSASPPRRRPTNQP